MHLSMFSPRIPQGAEGEVAGILWGLHSQNSHCPREFDRRHLRCFSEKTEEIVQLCLNLKARHMGRELNCLIP